MSDRRQYIFIFPNPPRVLDVDEPGPDSSCCSPLDVGSPSEGRDEVVAGEAVDDEWVEVIGERIFREAVRLVDHVTPGYLSDVDGLEDGEGSVGDVEERTMSPREEEGPRSAVAEDLPTKSPGVDVEEGVGDFNDYILNSLSPSALVGPLQVEAVRAQIQNNEPINDLPLTPKVLLRCIERLVRGGDIDIPTGAHLIYEVQYEVDHG